MPSADAVAGMSVVPPTLAVMEMSDARRLAGALMAEHGLASWRLEFDRAKRRAGICRYDRATIGLSAPLTRLHSESEVRDTVLHEIAHALAGPGAGHGPRWQAIARRIGCSGERCVSAESPRVPGAWVGTCPVGHTAELHRRPERVRSCSVCTPGRFSADHILEWTHRGQPTPMHPNYLAELEAIRTGRRVRIAAPGMQVRITAAGPWQGTVGTVVKRGRTRYHVKVKGDLLGVPFGVAEPV